MAQNSPSSMCESCGEQEATILFTRIEADEKQTLRLCSACASREAERAGTAPKKKRDLKTSAKAPAKKIKAGQPIEDGTEKKVVEVNVVVGHLAKTKSGKSVPCPRCGMTYEQFRKGGRFGCSDCYEAFSSELGRLFKRIHRAEQHAGKSPQAPPEAVDDEVAADRGQPRGERTSQIVSAGEEIPADIATREAELAQLSAQLEEAVQKEDYERAAELRDRIANLETVGPDDEGL